MHNERTEKMCMLGGSGGRRVIDIRQRVVAEDAERRVYQVWVQLGLVRATEFEVKYTVGQ